MWDWKQYGQQLFGRISEIATLAMQHPQQVERGCVVGLLCQHRLRHRAGFIAASVSTHRYATGPRSPIPN